MTSFEVCGCKQQKSVCPLFHVYMRLENTTYGIDEHNAHSVQNRNDYKPTKVKSQIATAIYTTKVRKVSENADFEVQSHAISMTLQMRHVTCR